MADMSRQAYRERLKADDVVYLVEGEGALGHGSLTLKKASVMGPESEGKRYPYLALWKAPDSGPGVSGVSKSPREVFTEQEVIAVAEVRDPSLLVSGREVDVLAQDPIVLADLVAVLGQEVVSRLAQDELAHPGDPERLTAKPV